MPGEIPDLTRAQLEELQLERLRNRLARAYDKVPHYRSAFDEAGSARATSTSPTWPTSRSRPRPTCGRTTRSACSPCRASRWPACTPAAVRRAGRPWSATPPPTSTGGPRSWPGRSGGRRSPGRRRARRLRLRAVHRRAGCALRRGAARLHGRPGQRRHDRAAGPADHRLRAAGDHGDPSYFLAILDEMERQGLDPRASSLEIGIFGAEPWTDQMRPAVEERSGIRAVDIYGLSEVIGPASARSRWRPRTGCTSGRTTSSPR